MHGASFSDPQGHPHDLHLSQQKRLQVVHLYSRGGLDSLAAAFQSASASARTFLVSHVTRNKQTARRPIRVSRSPFISWHSTSHYQFFVSSQADEEQAFDHDVETSQRTRSFLFLVLGALAARRLGSNEILMMAENGQMAVHLPLTNARIGAFSTHTAHPDVLAAMQRFLSTALGYPISIVNPFIHHTKAEVISDIARDCADLIPLSESCWKNTRLPQDFTHCGECIPCYVRRIAVETWIPDPTAYLRDPWRQVPSSTAEDDIAHRNLYDLVEFVRRVSKYSVEEMTNEWPELYSPNLSAAQVIDMYKRFASEALAVLEELSHRRGATAMRISHRELETCRRNPKRWYREARTPGRRGPPPGYNGLLKLGIVRYHKTADSLAARTHLAQLYTNAAPRLKNVRNVERCLEQFDHYIRTLTEDHTVVADARVRINLSGAGFLELTGEIHRVDVL